MAASVCACSLPFLLYISHLDSQPHLTFSFLPYFSLNHVSNPPTPAWDWRFSVNEEVPLLARVLTWLSMESVMFSGLWSPRLCLFSVSSTKIRGWGSNIWDEFYPSSMGVFSFPVVLGRRDQHCWPVQNTSMQMNRVLGVGACGLQSIRDYVFERTFYKSKLKYFSSPWKKLLWGYILPYLIYRKLFESLSPIAPPLWW